MSTYGNDRWSKGSTANVACITDSSTNRITITSAGANIQVEGYRCDY